MGSPDPETGAVDPNKTFVVGQLVHDNVAQLPLTDSQVDAVKEYVEWACDRQFGVMDVIVPRDVYAKPVGGNPFFVGSFAV